MEISDLKSQFKNPSTAFKMMPLWFWNHELNSKLIQMQIDDMANHGMGGFFINPRPGRLTPYMSTNFLEKIESAADHSKKLGLWCNLYDEDNYPSGFAGGKITGPDFPENRAKFIVLIDQNEFEGNQLIKYEIDPESLKSNSTFYAAIAINNSESNLNSPNLLDVTKNVRLESTAILEWNAPLGTWSVYFFCMYTNPPNSRVNGYIDILRKKTVQDFIDQIYKKYINYFNSKNNQDYFGTTIPLIFTDEPGMSYYDKNATFSPPWVIFTPELPRIFEERYHYPFVPAFLSLFIDIGKKSTKYRGDYWDCVSYLSTDAYYQSLHEITEKNNLSLVGHVNCEGSFPPHVKYNGDYFRIFQYFEWAGVDQLGKSMRVDGIETYCDLKINAKNKNLITENWLLDARLSRSTAILCNKPRQMVECFGAGNWDITLADCKTIVDTLLATGCDFFIPHAIAYSIDGYRKNDHPAMFNYQPYYQHWNCLAEYTARLCSIFNHQNGVEQIPVLCLYPIKSFWAEMEPHTSIISRFLGNTLPFISESLNRQQLDHIFAPEEQIISCKINQNDIIYENLSSNCNSDQKYETKIQNGKKNSFKCLIIGSLTTISIDFAEWLLRYYNQGGRILALGLLPTKIYNLNPELQKGTQSNLDLEKQNQRLIEIIQIIFKINVIDYITSWKSNKIDKCIIHENTNSCGGFASFIEIPFEELIPNTTSVLIEQQMHKILPVSDRTISFWKQGCSLKDGGHPAYLITQEKICDSEYFLFAANTSKTLEYSQVELNFPKPFDIMKIWDPFTGEIRSTSMKSNSKVLTLDFQPNQSYCISFSTSKNSSKSLTDQNIVSDHVDYQLLNIPRIYHENSIIKKIELNSNWHLSLNGQNAAFLGKNWHFSIKSWAIDEFKYGTTYNYSHKFIIQKKDQVGKLHLVIDGLVGDSSWGKDFYDELKGGQYAQFDLTSIPKISINKIPVKFDFNYSPKFLDPFWLVTDISKLVLEGENEISFISESVVDRFYAHFITDPWRIIGQFCVQDNNPENIPILTPALDLVSCGDLTPLGYSHYHGSLIYEQSVFIPAETQCDVILSIKDVKDCIELLINHKKVRVCWWNWTINISDEIKLGSENIITLIYYGTAQNIIESNPNPFGIKGKIQVLFYPKENQKIL